MCVVRQEISLPSWTLRSWLRIPLETCVCVALRRADAPSEESHWLSLRFILFRLILKGNRPEGIIRQKKKENVGGTGFSSISIKTEYPKCWHSLQCNIQSVSLQFVSATAHSLHHFLFSTSYWIFLLIFLEFQLSRFSRIFVCFFFSLDLALASAFPVSCSF
jgi:hypothetical protein